MTKDWVAGRTRATDARFGVVDWRRWETAHERLCRWVLEAQVAVARRRSNALYLSWCDITQKWKRPE